MSDVSARLTHLSERLDRMDVLSIEDRWAIKDALEEISSLRGKIDELEHPRHSVQNPAFENGVCLLDCAEYQQYVETASWWAKFEALKGATLALLAEKLGPNWEQHIKEGKFVTRAETEAYKACHWDKYRYEVVYEVEPKGEVL